MKKIYLLLGGVFFFSMVSWSCDLCSIYMNLEPNDLKSSMGFNYRYRSFEHSSVNTSILNNGVKHSIGNTILSETVEQQELFKSYDLWANYFIGTQWQIWGSFSFVDNSYIENDSTLQNIAGPGDLTLLAKYLVFNTKSTDSSNTVMRFIVGGGVKLPTGTFNKTSTITPRNEFKGNVVYGTPYEELDPHMQGGTGSFDFILMNEFLIRRKGLGFSTANSYRINTENSNQFRFANRFNSNNFLFYLIKIKSSAIAPSIGLTYEYSKRDQLRGEDYLHSGGNALFMTIGSKFYLKKFAIGATFLDPIRQQLRDDQLPNKNRVTTDLTYYF